MLRSSIGEIVLAASLVAVATATHRVNQALERPALSETAPGDIGALPDGKVIRVLSLGFERLVADLFWLRTVYYIGDDAPARAGYPAAGRLAELVTDIDPYFTTAYVIMNSVLATLGGRPDEAIALLDKGLRHDDSYWRMHFLQGFNYFYERQDFIRAAEYMRGAAERGGPDYLPLLATRLLAEAGRLDTAIDFVELRLRGEPTPQVREALLKRLVDLVIARDLAAIDTAIASYRDARGSVPPDVAALVGAGYLDAEPLDPARDRYRIRDGSAETDMQRDDLRLRWQGGA